MNILLADDHVLFRDALVQFMINIHPEWQVETVSSFHDAQNALGKKSYDLVLLDLRMPGMDRLSGLRIIRETYPDQKVAIITGVAEDHHVKEAIALGASGYLPKTLSGKTLVHAISLIVKSDHVFVPLDAANEKIMPSYYDDSNNTPQKNNADFTAPDTDPFMANLSKLTAREKEVLTLLSQGLSNKEIARELDVQTPTIKLHVGNLCKKLNVNNRTQAAIMAHQYGIVPKLEIPSE